MGRYRVTMHLVTTYNCKSKINAIIKGISAGLLCGLENTYSAPLKSFQLEQMKLKLKSIDQEIKNKYDRTRRKKELIALTIEQF